MCAQLYKNKIISAFSFRFNMSIVNMVYFCVNTTFLCLEYEISCYRFMY